ncbi:MAG: nucleotidyltransferase family protein [Pseudomonadota bacterium]
MLSDLPILILAAGQSSRMRGGDKLMEVVEGKPLLRRQIDNARSATGGGVIVTLPPAPHPRQKLVQATSAQIVPVPDAALGMSASLRRGLGAISADAPAAMILLADLPELTPADLRRVLAAVNTESSTLIWRGATEDGKPGHPIVFARPLFTVLQRMQGDDGGQKVVSEHQDRMTIVRLPGQRARLDLDTPEDWHRWRTGKL